jgi:hypothetical protein
VSVGSLCTGVIVRLLEAKGYAIADLDDIPDAQLHSYFVLYRGELALEEVHRSTDIRYKPATVETIFTERDVETWKDGQDTKI